MADPVTQVDPAAAPPPAAPQLSPGQKLLQAAPLEQQPPVETPPPAEPPSLSPRLAKLKDEFGFENVADEGEAFDRLVDYTKNLKNEFSAQLQSAIAELKQTQPTTVAPPPPTQDAKGKWTWAPPAVDPTIVSQFRTADGWKPETPADIKAAAEARQAYLDSFARKFVNDPAGTLRPLLEDTFGEFFDQRFGDIASQQQQQSYQQQVFSENPWLWEKDPVSNQPKIGVLSPEGQLLNQHFVEAERSGMSFDMAWKYAHAMHTAAKLATQNKTDASSQTAAEVNAQHKADMLARAGSPAPSRGASLPAPAAPNQTQNRHLSFGERFRQNAQRNGVPLHPLESA